MGTDSLIISVKLNSLKLKPLRATARIFRPSSLETIAKSTLETSGKKYTRNEWKKVH